MNSKRILSGKVFVLVMLALPLVLFFCGALIKSQEEAISIRAGIVYDEGDPWQNTLFTNITARPDITWVGFSPGESVMMEEQVKTGRLACGYIFHEDMERRISQGRMTDLITLVRSPQSIGSKLISESVFAALLELAASDLAANELVRAFAVPYDQAYPYVTEKIMGYSTTQNFVHPETVYAQGGEGPEETDDALIGQRVLHGIIALFILTALTFMLPRFIAEKQSGIAIKLGYAGACQYYGSLFLSMVCLILVFGLLSLLMLTQYYPAAVKDFGMEALLLLAYTAAMAMLASLLIQLLSKSDWIYAAYVFILILTFCLGGIVLDLGEINPWLGTIANCLPSSAYINGALYGLRGTIWVLAGFWALGLVGCLIAIRRTCRVR